MRKLFLLGLLSLGLGFSACEKDEAAKGMSRMDVKMTDAPGAYDSILLHVKEIEIISSGGRTTINVDSSEPFNILEFTLGKDTLIASQDVPSGRLQEVRLILHEDGNRIVVDGQSHPLSTPSGQSSGVKIKVQEELIPGVAYTLLLDFDAAQSIIVTGNGTYKLKPVIRAIPTGVSGAITGTIVPATAHAKVYAIQGIDTLGTIANTEGKFYFAGVAAGTYKIEIKPILPFMDSTIANVSVSTGNITNIGTIVLR